VVLGGVLTPSTGILGALCGRKKCRGRISLPYRFLCSLALTHRRLRNCVHVSTVPVYDMASSGCSHSAVHYRYGGLSSYKAEMSVSGCAVVLSWSGVFQQWHVVTRRLYFAIFHSALELDVHGLFSLSQVRYCMMGYLLLLCMAMSYVRKGVLYFDWGRAAPALPFMEMAETSWLQINQSTQHAIASCIVFPGAESILENIIFS
jgi:hypothetical protein